MVFSADKDSVLGADRLQVHFQTKSKSRGKSKKQVCLFRDDSSLPCHCQNGALLGAFILYLNLDWWKTGFHGQKISFSPQKLVSLLPNGCKDDLD